MFVVVVFLKMKSNQLIVVMFYCNYVLLYSSTIQMLLTIHTRLSYYS